MAIKINDMRQVQVQVRVLLGLALLILFQVATAQNPATTSAAAANEYVEAHNRARAEVGVGPLQWNQTLANLTDLMVHYQRIRKGCAFAQLEGSRYGGNQMWARGEAVSPRDAVEEWVKEKVFYNYSTNTCEEGHNCDVYTQVVWRNSQHLGCAQATCEKEGITLTICYYNPAGNLVSDKPY